MTDEEIIDLARTDEGKNRFIPDLKFENSTFRDYQSATDKSVDVTLIGVHGTGQPLTITIDVLRGMLAAARSDEREKIASKVKEGSGG